MLHLKSTLKKIKSSIFISLASSMFFHAQIAHADYLDLSSTSPTKTSITVDFKYYSGATYKVKWKKKGTMNWSVEKNVDTSNATLSSSDTRLYYGIGSLQCKTTYKIKAKMKGRGWRDVEQITKACT